MRLYLLMLTLIVSAIKVNATDITSDDSTFRNVTVKLETQAIGTTNEHVPFWMRTNTFGSIPDYGASGSLIASFHREYDSDSSGKLVDWGVGIEGRLNAGSNTRFIFPEVYVKAKISRLQLKIGRSKDIMGLADENLSSGNFAVSGNAPGIPKIEVSLPDYWDVPFTKGIVGLKGTFAYGLFGYTTLNRSISYSNDAFSYYHQKSLYGRIGKQDWKLKLYGGINHQVMWGNERRIYGNDFGLSQLETLFYVTVGKAYGTNSIVRSKIGNHIGSIDQAVSYDFRNLTVKLYHQFFYEVGGLYHLNNIKDGLWGISFQNTRQDKKTIDWNQFLFEFVSSKSQGGEFDAKITPSGDEDYYNNFLYTKGWTYSGENIGNNFMTNKSYQRKELPQQPHEYIGNNRIILFHFGATWKFLKWDIKNKLSYSLNYGTYATSPMGNTTGSDRQIFPGPYFYPVNQFSACLEASRPLKKGYNVGFVLAGDYGDLLYNAIGGMVKFSKTW